MTPQEVQRLELLLLTPVGWGPRGLVQQIVGWVAFPRVQHEVHPGDNQGDRLGPIWMNPS